MDNVEKQINNSFKWSAITEIIVKLISPILNAVLARILLPEDFAPLTTVTMIISFCEIFIESGFKKFLIQVDLNSESEEQNYFDVAFWTNLCLSIFIWIGLSVISKPLATFMGNPDLWLAIILSGIILPMYSVVGIFSAKLQKHLLFKKIFWVRMVTALIPLFVTIPLALLGWNYWSLIVGNIASVLSQMVVMVVISNHKIHMFFSANILRKMYSYGIWTLLDGIAVWLTAWIDSLIIARYMSDYYLGIYKNSLSTVTALFGIVTSAIIPVLFVGLSKYQHYRQKFSDFFNDIQRRLALVLIPFGAGMYIYDDIAVSILFGNQWEEAADIVGVTALTIAIRTVFVSICSDAYRAKGKFKIPLVLQVIDNMLLIPLCILSAKMGFWTLVYVRAIARLFLVVPELFIMYKILGIDIVNQIKKMFPIAIAALTMSLVCVGLRNISVSFIWSIISIFISICVYAIIIFIFPSSRKDVTDLIKKVGRND